MAAPTPKAAPSIDVIECHEPCPWAIEPRHPWRTLFFLRTDGQSILATLVEQCREQFEFGPGLAIVDPAVGGFPAGECNFLVMLPLLQIQGIEHVDAVIGNFSIAHEHLLERLFGDAFEYCGCAKEAGLSTPCGTHTDHLTVAHGSESGRLIHSRV